MYTPAKCGQPVTNFISVYFRYIVFGWNKWIVDRIGKHRNANSFDFVCYGCICFNVCYVCNECNACNVCNVCNVCDVCNYDVTHVMYVM